MKPSKRPTPYLLIKAYTTADYDPVNYAIVHLSSAWLVLIGYRLSLSKDFSAVKDFHCFSYWDDPLGFYHLDEAHIAGQQLIAPHDDKGFIIPEPGDVDNLPEQDNRLEAGQLLMTKDGIAHFKAFARYTGEKYWTAEFNLNRLIAGKPT